ncbi:MAG TPA: hypothetical protein VKO18_13480 [Terriglobia bacterium]|nr:hypothetical protein [Terriglobia bacterium]
MGRRNELNWTSTIASFIFAASVCISLIWASRSYGIPAFARKYQTSCATCHNNYPELNDFGEAFKKNGFKFPKDDELFVKEPPVMLGAKAQKDAFPKAIYPGEIPASVPISFRYSGNFNWNAKQPQPLQASAFVPQTDLFVPNTFTIISSGSFGDNFAFWVDDDISTAGSGSGGGMGDGYLRYNDLGRIFHLPKNALNVRFGQFELDLPFSQARTIYPSSYDVYSETAVGAAAGSGQTIFQTTHNPFVLGSPQRGIEFGGYPNNGNFTWSVAFNNGTNTAYGLPPFNGLTGTLTGRNTKDVYIRVSQRFNLEQDPESRQAIQAAGPTGPRDHTSIRIGAFYYSGINEMNIGATQYSFLGTIREPFYRTGADVRFKYRKMELFGLGMVGHDNNHSVDTVGQTITSAPAVTYTGGFVGSNFWIYPWTIAYMRYDFVNSPTDFANGVSQNRTRNRFSPGFQVLVRANIKVIGEYQYHWGEPYTDPTTGSTLFFRPNSFVSGIDYSF